MRTIQLQQGRLLLLLLLHGSANLSAVSGSSGNADYDVDTANDVGGWDVQDDALLLLGEGNKYTHLTTAAAFVQQESALLQDEEFYGEEDYYYEGQVPVEERDPTLMYPLSCNAALEQQSSLESFQCPTLFSSLPAPPNGAPVTIPCGTCVTMDSSETTLTLPDGLNIEGLLRIPATVRNLVISTPFVYVQGILQIHTHGRAWSPSNLSVKFFLTGTQDRFLVPHEDNAQACLDEDPQGCLVGKKAFVVAGGRVDIRAAPNGDCPSWAPLQDLLDDKPVRPSVTSIDDLPFGSPLPSGCSSRVLLDERWEGGENPLGWTGNTYASYEVTSDNTFMVTNRNHIWQGPFLRLLGGSKEAVSPWSLSCMEADRDYLLRVRFRLSRTDGGTPNCSSTGRDCPFIHSRLYLSDGTEVNRRWGSPNAYVLAGTDDDDEQEWMELTQVFRWSWQERAADKRSHMIWLMGPETGTDIEVRRFTIELPPNDLYPGAKPDDTSKVCRELVPGQGPDGIQPPYPISNNADPNRFHVEQEVLPNGQVNKFYRLAKRWEAWHSIAIPILPECVEDVKGSRYEVSLRLRIHSTAVGNPKVAFRVTPAEGSATNHYLPPCPRTGGNLGWVSCRVTWVVPDIAPNAERVQMWIDSGEAAKEADVDYDDVSISFEDGGHRRLILPSNVAEDCWGVGSELVLTTPTTSHFHHQVAIIEDMKMFPEDDGWAIVELDTKIYAVTTAKQDERFAVEVALLARNVVIEGQEETENPLHGGHFMVMNTPRGDQHIEGVEFRNMGQQQLLGRYPVHFHMCGSVRNSVVSKNLVRSSHQRCYVIHGTNDLLLEDNVSFQTRGHCIMLEDGAEVRNRIFRNLVIYVKSAAKIKADESDDRPSGFWIANSRNQFVGNVAAGVTFFGFWFEMRARVRGASAELPGNDFTPFTQPLLQFDDNSAHGCGTGIRTYPNGMIPPYTSVMRNLRIYRNLGTGMFIHVVNRFQIDGGVFADNGAVAIFQSKVNNVEFRNLDIMGTTDLYRQLRVERKVRHRCDNAPSSQSSLLGVQWSHFYSGTQGVTKLENVRFGGFDDSECLVSAAIGYDWERMLPHNNIMTTMTNVDFDSDKTPFVNACRVEETLGVDDVYFHDVQSTLHPDKRSTFKGVSAIVSSKPTMTKFLNNCQEMAVGSCVSYCEDACVRSVTFFTDAWGTEHYTLRITHTKTKKNIKVPGKFRILTRSSAQLRRKVTNIYDTTEWKNLRAFSVTLPAGRYKGEFLDADNNPVSPRFLQTQYEAPPPCAKHLKEGDIRVVLPEVTMEECMELVQNGDGELMNYTYWYHRGGGVNWFPHGGVDHSAAIRSAGRFAFQQGFGQYLDTNCLRLMQGHMYEMTARFQLREGGNLEEVRGCKAQAASATTQCPEVVLYKVEYDSETRKFKSSETQGGAEAVGPTQDDSDDEWHWIHGVFPITSTMAQADAVFFQFASVSAAAEIVVDDVSLHHFQRPQKCEEVILNGDFDSDSTPTLFWEVRLSEGVLDWVSGNGGSGKALVTKSRSNLFAGPLQKLELACLVNEYEYEVHLKFRLVLNDQQIACDPAEDEGNRRCPQARLRVRRQDGSDWFPHVATVTDPGSTTSWGTMSGSFVVSESVANARAVEFFVNQAALGVDIVVDNVSIRPTIPLCPSSNWIIPGGWQSHGNAEVSLEENTGEIVVAHRQSQSDGAIHELAPHRCLESQVPFRLTARVRPDRKGKFYKCRVYKPGRKVDEKSCPVVSLVSTLKETGKRENRQVATVTSRKAESDGYQRVDATIVLTAAEVHQATSLSIAIHGPPAHVTLLVADMQFSLQ